MNVIEVLEACRQETEDTHWCQGHYEDMVEWAGTPEEFAEILNEKPDLFRKQQKSIYDREVGITADDLHWLYKVKHCLMGQVNHNLGAPTGLSSTDAPREIGNEETRETWLATVNRLGLTIFGAYWQPDTRQPADEYMRAEADRRGVDVDQIGSGIEGWNDEDVRVKEDILAVLDRAIAAEKESA